jgi:hypothetical protein
MNLVRETDQDELNREREAILGKLSAECILESKKRRKQEKASRKQAEKSTIMQKTRCRHISGNRRKIGKALH